VTNRSLLSTAILSVLLAAGCGGGGGGGGTRPDAPPPPPTSPPPPPPPATCEDEDAINYGDEGDCEFRYTGRADNALVGTNADVAQAEGFTGEGVKVGVLDDARYEGYAPLEGKVDYYEDFTSADATEPDSNDKRGHGTVISTIIAGTAGGDFKGGIAPDASIYWGRICADDTCRALDAMDAATALAAEGVKIFNLSVSSVRETEDEQRQSAAGWEQAMRPALEAGGLIIAAAGNDARDTANYPAATPRYQPQWESQWLSVVALELDDNGNPDELSSYSNKCGHTADWCLGAPGLYEFPGIPGSAFDSGAGQGTSFATAGVSGVAALVAGAFPWMSASNLQQTLLTTARDMGAPGVDAVFGWGAVDAAAAVKGPGMFVTDFDARVTGTSTFSNDISGNGGLVKGGDGTLVLAGNNTYLGDTTVEAGVLALVGDVSGDVVVAGGDLYARGGSIGGNYTVGELGDTAIKLGMPLEVTGAALIDGGLLLSNPDSSYEVESTEDVLTAGTVEGTFSDVVYANDFLWTVDLDYTDTSVVAELTRNAAASAATASGASVAVVDGAESVDALIGFLDEVARSGDTAGYESILASGASLLNANNAQAAAAFESLTGQVHGMQRALSVQTALNDTRAAVDRLPHLAGTTRATGWVQADAVDGEMKRDGYSTADYDQFAVTVGVDVPVGRNGTVVGASLSKGDTRGNIDSSTSHLDEDRIGITGYLHQPIGSAYVSAVVGHGSSDVDTGRMVSLGRNRTYLEESREDDSWGVNLEAGYRLASGATPFLGLTGIVHNQDAFSEDDASGLGLSASDDSVTAIYADLGLRHRRESGRWTQDFMVAYRALLNDPTTDFNAWYTGAPEAKFTVQGYELSSDAIRAALGAGFRLTPNATVYGSLGLEQASGQNSNANANLGLRWMF